MLYFMNIVLKKHGINVVFRHIYDSAVSLGDRMTLHQTQISLSSSPELFAPDSGEEISPVCLGRTPPKDRRADRTHSHTRRDLLPAFSAGFGYSGEYSDEGYLNQEPRWYDEFRYVI